MLKFGEGGEESRTINLISFLALSVKCRIILKSLPKKTVHGYTEPGVPHPSFPSSHPPTSLLNTHKMKLVATQARVEHFYKQSLVPQHELKKLIRVCVHNYWVLEKSICSNKKIQETKMPKVMFILIMTSEPFIVFQPDITNLKLCS